MRHILIAFFMLIVFLGSTSSQPVGEALLTETYHYKEEGVLALRQTAGNIEKENVVLLSQASSRSERAADKSETAGEGERGKAEPFSQFSSMPEIVSERYGAVGDSESDSGPYLEAGAYTDPYIPPRRTSKKAAMAPQTSLAPSGIQTITLSFAGDCTLGDDDKYTWNTFDAVYAEAGDPAYFFSGVQSIFVQDDLTFVNFEGALTTATKKAEKEYRFKGDPSYIEILKQGSIEAVTLANNHSLDYLEAGFKDTVDILKENGVPYTYFETTFVEEIKGMKIGYLGYKGWEHEKKSNALLKEHVKAMRKQGVNFIVANYHWGDERSYIPNQQQRRMAHFAIDNGVDLVIGHHPHVLQGMEVYKGKPILYSLGNFCFGGAPNPKDKDTIIYQHIITYNAASKEIIKTESNIIPARVSSEAHRNDYRPILATGEEKDRIEKKFLEISLKINE